MIDTERMREYVMELIRVDSVSKKEKEVAVKLKRDLDELGAECYFDNAGDRVGANTGNLIAKIEGNESNAPPILLSAHMDTVEPGEGIEPSIDDGVIRSDGTTILGSDDKAGLAVIIEVLRTIKDRGLPCGNIEIAFTVCEEIGLLGAKHIATSAFDAKYGIVLDSSSPSYLVTQCPSSEKLEFRVIGLEAHAGVCPERGLSAIQVAGEAISKMNLGRIDEETTANIGLISGGMGVNIIPNCVHITGEVRSHSERKLRKQIDHMRTCFKEAASHYEVVLDGERVPARVEEVIERLYEKMDVSTDSVPAKLINKAVENLDHEITPRKIGGGCDANYFNLKGIECVNLGTGMREIHTVNEYLVLEEFNRSAEIMLEALQLNTRLKG